MIPQLSSIDILNLKLSMESKPRRGWSREDHFQSEIIAILRERGVKTILCDMNGRNVLHGKKKQLLGADKGDPDFHIVLRGRVIYVEVKTDEGKQSKEQKTTQLLLTSLGHDYYLCRGIEGVIGLINKINNEG